jgi:hypothetical protein
LDRFTVELSRTEIFELVEVAEGVSV